MSVTRSGIKAVAVDVDGTLLDGDHKLRNAVNDALSELAANNIGVILATARGPRAIGTILRQLTFSPLLVCFSGAWVGEVDKESLLPQRATLDARHSLSVARSIAARAVDLKVQPNVFTVSTWRAREMTPEIALECQLTDCDPEITSDLLKDSEEPNKILLISGDADSNRALQSIADSVQSVSNPAFSKPSYLEIVPRGVNKAQALKHLTAILGLQLSQVAAIGDGLNDIEMIREAGLGIAMGNAPAAVKSVADWVTGTNNEAGVAQAVRKLFEQELV